MIEYSISYYKIQNKKLPGILLLTQEIINPHHGEETLYYFFGNEEPLTKEEFDDRYLILGEIK